MTIREQVIKDLKDKYGETGFAIEFSPESIDLIVGLREEVERLKKEKET